ncbi:hypothetical protein [Archangium sp.]|uniref:hypothetical protein n=1 Tax=Archangium sp. TaxID=1872627 RepID=UPI002D2D209B|nr:hypothetical protein [Archangium sp.]HYO54723.1 hypothetical protein [Archangium sp.]
MQIFEGLSLACLGLLACASTPGTAGETKDYGYREDGQVWVRGPWGAINPSKDVDAVIDQLCPAVMDLPRARLRDYGQEYCGAIYTLGDGIYYASHTSTLSNARRIGGVQRKSCIPPRYVNDERGRAVVHGDYHNHPYAANDLSTADKQAANQIWSIRIQFDAGCIVMMLVPHIGEARPGEVFRREGKSWKLIGMIKPEDKMDGIMTPVGE